MRTASATFNRETGQFTLVVGGSDSELANRATAEQDLFFDLWVYNDYEMERLNVSGKKLEKTGHALIYSRDAS